MMTTTTTGIVPQSTASGNAGAARAVTYRLQREGTGEMVAEIRLPAARLEDGAPALASVPLVESPARTTLTRLRTMIELPLPEALALPAMYGLRVFYLPATDDLRIEHKPGPAREWGAWMDDLCAWFDGIRADLRAAWDPWQASADGFRIDDGQPRTAFRYWSFDHLLPDTLRPEGAFLSVVFDALELVVRVQLYPWRARLHGEEGALLLASAVTWCEDNFTDAQLLALARITREEYGAVAPQA